MKILFRYLLLFVITNASLIFLTSCVQKRNLALSEQTPSESILLPSLEENLFEAEKLAHKWNSDAYIREINIDIIKTDDGIEFEYFFSFRKLNDGNKILLVVCKDNSCSSDETISSISIPDCLPLTLKDFSMSAQDAFQIGLEHGGVDYIHRELSINQLTLSSHCFELKPTWEVSFFDIVSQEGIDITIDAQTGEIIDDDTK